MKKREQFIDLMEEINPRHLDEHIEKNTNTKKAQIRRYIVSAGIYAAACLVVCLIIPFIINETGIGLNPGTNPPVSQTTDDTQGETEAPDVTEPPHASIEDIIDKLGYTQYYKMTVEELTGFDNRIESEDISGKIVVEVTDMTETFICMTIETLEVDYADGSNVTTREITIDQAIAGNGNPVFNWKLNGMYELELFEAQGMFVFGRNQADTELYGGFVSEYHIVAGTDYGYIAPASGKNNMSYSLYVEDGKLMYGLYNNVYLTNNVYDILFSITSREGWLEERGTVSLKYNEVIFTPTSNMYMDEEYIANLERIFAEVKVQQVIEMSDGTVYDFTPFATFDELMAYNRVKVIRTKLDSYLREVYYLTADENNVDIPVFLDAEFLAENMGKNEVALRGLYEDYLGKTHRIILASLNKLIPEERRFQRRPEWDDGTEQYDGIDGNLYYILDDTVVIPEEDREEFAQYLECRYGQVDVEHFENIRGKYENVGVVAVYEMGEWYWYNTADDSITKIERFPNYYTVDGMYRKAEITTLLRDYTVYEVTVESNYWVYEKLKETEEAQRPEKVALRFSDAEDLIVLMHYVKDSEVYIQYYITHIINKNVIIGTYLPYHMLEFYTQYKNGTTVISIGEGYGRNVSHYIIQGDEYYILENQAQESEVTLKLFINENGEVEYLKENEKFVVMDIYSLIMAYESDDEFFDERGILSFENGEVKYNPEIIRTFGEGGWVNDEHIVEFYEYHGVSSFAELKEVYEQFIEDGRVNEFNPW